MEVRWQVESQRSPSHRRKWWRASLLLFPWYEVTLWKIPKVTYCREKKLLRSPCRSYDAKLKDMMCRWSMNACWAGMEWSSERGVTLYERILRCDHVWCGKDVGSFASADPSSVWDQHPKFFQAPINIFFSSSSLQDYIVCIYIQKIWNSQQQHPIGTLAEWLVYLATLFWSPVI